MAERTRTLRDYLSSLPQGAGSSYVSPNLTVSSPTIDKNTIGLSNVDNTSDAQKVESGPISEALKELDLKSPLVDGDFVSNDAQFAIDNIPNVTSLWKIAGGAGGSGPSLVVIGDAEDITGIISSKGIGNLAFGNGGGVLVELVNPGASGSNVWFQIIPARDSSPILKSQRGARHQITNQNTFTIESDSASLLSVKKTYDGASPTPASTSIEMSATGTVMRAVTGDLSFTLADTTKNITTRNPRFVGRQIEANATLLLAGTFVNAGTYNAPADTRRILGSAANIASFTVVLPPSPVEGQLFSMSTDFTITSLTVSGSPTPGPTPGVYGAPSTISPGTPFELIYTNQSSINRWLRVR